MIRLIRTETNRYLSRRMTRYVPLILALLMTVGAVIAYIVVQSEDGSINFVTDIAFESNDDADGGFAPPGLEAPEGRTFILGPLGFLLPIIGFALGASFYGADQKAGVIELLLTWQPKRHRLLGARAIGGFVATTVIVLALSSFFVAVMYGLASVTGTTDGMTGEMWGWIASSVVRTALSTGGFFLMGLGLTAVVNSSVASIVGFAVYVFVVENLLSTFVELVAPWLPMVNTRAYTFRDNVAPITFFQDGLPEIHHGSITAGLIMAAYCLIVVFARRDVS